MAQQITGKTKLLGVIGDPIAHSLSPVMQNAAIVAAGLDYTYVALPVKPGALETAVAGLKALGFVGWNVTIPHKRAIIPLLDEIEEDARRIGAVNTVFRRADKWIGTNTDVAGFLAGLEGAGFSACEKRVVILGAGGAARAVLWGVVKSHASSVTILARSADKAQELADAFCDAGEGCTLAAATFGSDAARAALSSAELIVQTTPLGMHPHEDGMAPIDWEDVAQDAFLYDIIYTPAKTRFLREGEARGHAILNGAPMLLGQGAAALALWTDAMPDAGVMRAALEAAL